MHPTSSPLRWGDLILRHDLPSTHCLWFRRRRPFWCTILDCQEQPFPGWFTICSPMYTAFLASVPNAVSEFHLSSGMRTCSDFSDPLPSSMARHGLFAAPPLTVLFGL